MYNSTASLCLDLLPEFFPLYYFINAQDPDVFFVVIIIIHRYIIAIPVSLVCSVV